MPKLVSLAKGKNDLRGFKAAKKVLIKPNLTSAYNQAANTSAAAVRTILDFFKEFDPGFARKKIVIAESSGEAFNRGERMEDVFRRFKTLSGQKQVRVPKEILEFDFRISAALPKTHDTVMATLNYSPKKEWDAYQQKASSEKR